MRTLTPIFSIIIALLIFFFFVQPQYAEVQLLNEEIEKYDNAVQSAEDLNNLIESLIAQKRSHPVQAIEKLDLLVPPNLQTVRLLIDLETMADRNRMLFGNLEVSEDEPVILTGEGGGSETIGTNSFVTADISFSLIGTYEQFKSMLRDIERSVVLMDIISMNVAASEGRLQQFDLTVRTYSLPKSSN